MTKQAKQGKLSMSYLPVEKLTKYRNQKHDTEKKQKQYRAQVKETKAELDKLRKQYADIMRESVLEDDHSRDSELADLDRQIAEAEGRLKIAENKELLIRNAPKERGVTKQELIEDFNENFTPKFKEDVLNPVLARMEAAKLEMEEAAAEYRKVVDKFNGKRDELIAEMGESWRYKPATIEIKKQDEKERYFVTEKFARGIRY